MSSTACIIASNCIGNRLQVVKINAWSKDTVDVRRERGHTTCGIYSQRANDHHDLYVLCFHDLKVIISYNHCMHKIEKNINIQILQKL